MTHGTPTGYAKHGCRCVACTRAQRERMRDYRKRRTAYEELPPAVHTDDPRTLLSRILAGPGPALLTYDRAVHQAALSLALVVAIERAETNDPLSGEAA